MKGTNGRVQRVAYLAVIAVTVCAAVASTAGAAPKTSMKPETTSLTMPLTASSASVGYFVFASEKGYYDKYGLSVSSPASDPTQVKAAIVAGSTPLSSLAAVDTLGLLAGGLKLKVVGCQELGVPFQVWAKNGIKTANDLKGKSLGVTGLTSGLGISTLKYLATVGLAAADVTIVPLGSVPNMLAALTAGRIDAALLSYPFYQTASSAGGLHKLADAPASPNVYLADAAWAKVNRNTILSFFKGNTEALLAYASDRSAALPVLAKLLRLNLDDPTQGNTVREGYQLYHASFTPPHQCTKSSFDSFLPYLTPEQQAALDTAGKFLDNSYLQQLETSGFYAKLAKKYGAFPGIPQ